MTTETKRKRKCVKGTACGFSCISGKNQCSDKILKRDADALIKSATSVKSKTPIKPVDTVNINKVPAFVGGDESFSQKVQTDIPPDKVEITTAKVYTSLVPSIQVDIKVNGKAKADEAGVQSDKQALKVAIVAMRTVKAAIAKMPDGTLISNMPEQSDGKGDGRTKLYVKAGFSPPDQYGVMFAVVVSGKITPVTTKYLEEKHGYGLEE